MTLAEKFSLIVLILGLGTQLFRRPFLGKYLKIAWRFSIAGIFSIPVYWSYLQYEIWRQNELGKFFLPPYQKIGYFIYYVGSHFFAAAILALFAAIIITRIAKILNQKHNEQFFEPEELPLMSLGIFLTGYPGFLLYLVIVFLGALLFSILYSLFSRGRAPLFCLWLPTAILAIIIKVYIIPDSILNFFIL